MTPREQLQLIQKLSSFTQTEIATKLGVTFAALNRWMNEHALPRPGAQKKLNDLYASLVGEKADAPVSGAEAVEHVLAQKRKEHPDPLLEIFRSPDIRDQFLLSLTYNSNKVEGSTLSEADTAAVIFDNVALGNKTLTEQLEAKNHEVALEYLFAHLVKNLPIDEAFVLKLHSIWMQGILPNAGVYRTHAVRILGTNVPTTNPLSVQKKMTELARDFVPIPRRSAIPTIAAIHARFEQIHPFPDGNGRVGRLLMNAMLLQAKLPPALVRGKKKRLYYSALRRAQLDLDPKPLEAFVADAVLDGYAILERRRIR